MITSINGATLKVLDALNGLRVLKQLSTITCLKLRVKHALGNLLLTALFEYRPWRGMKQT